MDNTDYGSEIIERLRKAGFPDSEIMDLLAKDYNKAVSIVKAILEQEIGAAMIRNLLDANKITLQEYLKLTDGK